MAALLPSQGLLSGTPVVVLDKDGEAELHLFSSYNEHSKIPPWVFEQCRKQRLLGLKWACSIPSRTPRVILKKHRISFMVPIVNLLFPKIN
jgi:hypothetical protein